MNESFKMLVQEKEYTISMNSYSLTDHTWYVSVKEGEYLDVISTKILNEIKSRIESVYGVVGYITGRE